MFSLIRAGLYIRTNTCYNQCRKRGKNGIKLMQHGKRHDIYLSPITGKTFPVPRHAKEIAEGTLKSIKRDAVLQ